MKNLKETLKTFWWWTRRKSIITSTRRPTGPGGPGGSPSPPPGDLLVETLTRDLVKTWNRSPGLLPTELRPAGQKRALTLACKEVATKRTRTASKVFMVIGGSAGNAVGTVPQQLRFYRAAAAPGGTVNSFTENAENPKNKRQNKEISAHTHTEETPQTLTPQQIQQPTNHRAATLMTM